MIETGLKVKCIKIENFDISENNIQTHGIGESQPLAGKIPL